MIKRAYILLVFSWIVFLPSGWGQDRIFTYVYQSLVLNPGQKELEVWSTYRSGRSYYYRRLDSRLEFEIGLFKRLQTAFYLNYSGKAAAMIQDTVMVITTENALSFSNEWKYKFSDPVANAIGSAIYGEFTLGLTAFELECKIILDKRIGKVTQALNFVVEPEWEWKTDNEEVEAENEVKVEINYGLGVDLGKGFIIGLEARCPNVLTGDGNWSQSAFYAGPTLSYARNELWINFTCMPQIAGIRGIPNSSRLNLTEFERYQFRLLFAYGF